MDDVRAEEKATRNAQRKEAAKLTRIVDYHAQVIVTKDGNVPVAVTWTDAEGTHLLGLTDRLSQHWPEKNYIVGHAYVEALAQQIARDDSVS